MISGPIIYRETLYGGHFECWQVIALDLCHRLGLLVCSILRLTNKCVVYILVIPDLMVCGELGKNLATMKEC
jgi:hypothetical protein